MNNPMNRREFVHGTAALGVAGLLHSSPASAAFTQSGSRKPLNISVFSKHLQFLNYADMAQAAAEMGFDGVDLTVRPKGHVLPEKTKEDLPLAVEGLKQAGFAPGLMTTSILDANDTYTQSILETASQLGFSHYRLGYYRFPENSPIPGTLSKINEQVKALARLNKTLNIKGAYQNHAGPHVGAQIWDIWHMLDGIDNEYMGCQYDIRHASVEGAKSWMTGLRLIKEKVNTLVLKDYKWTLRNGNWTLVNVPIGEGMVDFKQYFSMLKGLGINVPVTMHFEYELGGAEHGQSDISIDRKQVLSAMKRDLTRAQTLWTEA